jgi:hypothetical protein
MNPKLSHLVRRVLPGLWPLASGIVCFGLGAAASTPLAAQSATASATSAPNLVSQPLPPASNDAPDEQPSPQHAWVPGHWHWGQGSYIWVAGHWEIPPMTYAVWVGPEWQQQASGYDLREGYWQQNPAPAQTQPTEIFTTQPPPPPRPEGIPERPTGDSVWIPGYWDWRSNQFIWAAGRWETPPRPNLTWVPTHWESRGDRFVLVAGYWRDSATAVITTPPPQQVVIAQPAPVQQVVVVGGPPPPRTKAGSVRVTGSGTEGGMYGCRVTGSDRRTIATRGSSRSGSAAAETISSSRDTGAKPRSAAKAKSQNAKRQINGQISIR